MKYVSITGNQSSVKDFSDRCSSFFGRHSGDQYGRTQNTDNQKGNDFPVIHPLDKFTIYMDMKSTIRE